MGICIYKKGWIHHYSVGSFQVTSVYFRVSFVVTLGFFRITIVNWHTKEKSHAIGRGLWSHVYNFDETWEIKHDFSIFFSFSTYFNYCKLQSVTGIIAHSFLRNVLNTYKLKLLALRDIHWHPHFHS